MEGLNRNQRVIILTTIYRMNGDATKHYKVTSYKLDPRGEEFYGEHFQVDNFNLTSELINRVFAVSGGTKHLPLVNSRLMLNTETNTIAFAINVNPYPKTTDYENPYQRVGSKSSTPMRVSIGEIMLVDFTPRTTTAEVSHAIINEIFSGAVATKLNHREKARLHNVKKKLTLSCVAIYR